MKIMKKSAFSLMEMMIVLLIVAIVAAATAPMITRKITRPAAGGSPWEYIGLTGNSIVFNQGGDTIRAAIGTAENPKKNNNPKLYIKTKSNEPHITFGDANNTSGQTVEFIVGGKYNASKAEPRIGITNSNVPYSSVVIGMGQNISNTAYDSVAIGNGATLRNKSSIVIGRAIAGTNGQSENGQIAIGPKAYAYGNNSIAIGCARFKSGQPDITYEGHTAANAGAIAIGTNARAASAHSIAIGSNKDNIPSGEKSDSTHGTYTYGEKSIAIGHKTSVAAHGDSKSPEYSTGAIAIGTYAQAANSYAIAIGGSEGGTSITKATGENSIAIGKNATAAHNNAVAIGTGASTTKANTIRLGTSSHKVQIPGSIEIDGLTSTSDKTYIDYNGTHGIEIGDGSKEVRIKGNVFIDGNLIVDKSAVLGANMKGTKIAGNISSGNDVAVYFREGATATGNSDMIKFAVSPTYSSTDHGTYNVTTSSWKGATTTGYLNFALFGSSTTETGVSIFGDYKVNVGICDRRLKNVGDKFKGGLEELKKIDLYHFTFKKDEKKVPQVGVMAQDLQKVFPTAVWEGSDGYLRIRWDEMFYAVINAVKELDARITTAFEQIKSNTEKITKLQKQVDEQQKVIENLEKRLEKLERRER